MNNQTYIPCIPKCIPTCIPTTRFPISNKIYNDIAIVIPTMRRKNKYEYLLKALEHNKHIFKNIKNVFIYCDVKDEDIKIIANKYNLKMIPKKIHTNNKFTDKYSFWRTNLCLDFVESITNVFDKCNSTYIMWLEDDTVLSPKTINNLMSFENNFDFTSLYTKGNYNGSGTCCIVINRNSWNKIKNLILQECFKDMPLDWIFGKGLGTKLLKYIKYLKKQHSI
jgi:hypothetical protein